MMYLKYKKVDFYSLTQHEIRAITDYIESSVGESLLELLKENNCFDRKETYEEIENRIKEILDSKKYADISAIYNSLIGLEQHGIKQLDDVKRNEIKMFFIQYICKLNDDIRIMQQGEMLSFLNNIFNYFKNQAQYNEAIDLLKSFISDNTDWIGSLELCERYVENEIIDSIYPIYRFLNVSSLLTAEDDEDNDNLTDYIMIKSQFVASIDVTIKKLERLVKNSQRVSEEERLRADTESFKMFSRQLNDVSPMRISTSGSEERLGSVDQGARSVEQRVQNLTALYAQDLKKEVLAMPESEDEQLLQAVKQNNVEILPILIKDALNRHRDLANVVEIETQRNILHLAVMNGNASMIQIILDLTSDMLVNSQEKEGNTPLHNAVANRRWDIVELLQNSSAVADLLNNTGISALALAKDFNFGCYLKMSVINEKIKAKIAHDNHLIAIVKQNLLDEAVRIMYECNTCKSGTDKFISLLKNKKIDINGNAYDGYTPLTGAVAIGNVDLVTILISQGALLNKRNYYGKTPVDYIAKLFKKTDMQDQQNAYAILMLLKKAGADFSRCKPDSAIYRLTQELALSPVNGSSVSGFCSNVRPSQSNSAFFMTHSNSIKEKKISNQGCSYH